MLNRSYDDFFRPFVIYCIMCMLDNSVISFLKCSLYSYSQEDRTRIHMSVCTHTRLIWQRIEVGQKLRVFLPFLALSHHSQPLLTPLLSLFFSSFFFCDSISLCIFPYNFTFLLLILYFSVLFCVSLSFTMSQFSFFLDELCPLLNTSSAFFNYETFSCV